MKLNLPPLLDFATLQPDDDVKIVIYNSKHKFSSSAKRSGVKEKKNPIFGSKVFINNELFSLTTYGLPFMRFAKGNKPKITFDNQTLYTTNIHIHGLATTGNVDGVTMEDVFGLNTSLGRIATFQYPEIKNNQCLLWFHSHNMFVSIELISAGIVGLLQITDKVTSYLTDKFEYGNNNLLLNMIDMDFDSNGRQTQANIVKGDNRSCFTVVNGISAVAWYTGPETFVNKLYHETNKNLVKIDMLNAGINWRVYYLGICDSNKKIKSFYQVQNDGGLMNPVKLKMLTVPVAGRVSIIIDLNKFKYNVAHLFFYNYDLTEVFSSKVIDNEIVGTIPDLNVENPTPYPTPIPDPGKLNQQGGQSALNYPIVPLIPQVEQVLVNGGIRVPEKYTMKVFLEINLKGECKPSKLSNVLTRIRKTVFGCENYQILKNLIKDPCFEYDGRVNYLKYLNPEYYYNLPKFDNSVPVRNVFLFSEIGNNNLTEYVLGAARILPDLWNSDVRSLKSS